MDLQDVPLNPNSLPADFQPITQGYINLRATVWCACGIWDDAQSNTLRGAGKVAKRLGWKYSRAKGWQCPDCA